MDRRVFIGGMAAGALARPAFAAKRTLRLAAVLSASSPCGMGVQAMADQIARESGGRLAIDLNMDGSIGSTRNMIQGLVDGSIDVVMAGLDTLGLVFKDAVAPLELCTMPYLYNSVAKARLATDGAIGAYCADVMRSWGIVVLGWPENGIRHVTANKPIRRLEDFQGLRLRLPESKVMLRFFSALGAAPGVLPFNQLREALRTGRFDAQENPVGNLVSAKLYEHQSHLSLTAHSYSVQFVAMPAAIWKELSASDKALFAKAARTAVHVSRKENERIDVDGISLVRQYGMQVVRDIDQASMNAGAIRAAGVLSTEYGTELVSKIRGLAAS